MEFSLKISGYNAVTFLFLVTASFILYISFESVFWIDDEQSESTHDVTHSIGMWEYCSCYDMDDYKHATRGKKFSMYICSFLQNRTYNDIFNSYVRNVC